VGDYVVEETNPFGFPLDISNYFNSDDLNPSDKNTAVDNSIGVELRSVKENTENNFVDINDAKISGTVKEDDQNCLVSVLITLKLLSGNSTVATTLTGSDGSYLFSGLKPGGYPKLSYAIQTTDTLPFVIVEFIHYNLEQRAHCKLHKYDSMFIEYRIHDVMMSHCVDYVQYKYYTYIVTFRVTIFDIYNRSRIPVL
jgi:hypothetical protein